MIPVVMVFDTIIQQFEYLGNNLIGNPLLIGALIMLFFVLMMLVLFFPFEAMVVILIPLGFVVFNYIAGLRVIFAIMCGIAIGLGLIKWYKR